MPTLILTSSVKAYWQLVKPGIIFGNLVTASAGFAFASKDSFHIGLFFFTLLGLSFVMASACVFNNYIDKELDAKMKRTKNRPLVKLDISEKAAFIFASNLGILGILCLIIWTGFLPTLLAILGFFVYVILYSFLKYKTVYFTLIGSLAGAIPPVVGYCAVAHTLDWKALILFAIVVFWQMPHFFAIAIYRLDDYLAGSIPVLPAKEGVLKTKIHMLAYMIAFITTLTIPFICGYLSYYYLIITLALSGTWLVLGIKGFKTSNDKRWARQIFLFSLIVIMGVSVVIPFSITS